MAELSSPRSIVSMMFCRTVIATAFILNSISDSVADEQSPQRENLTDVLLAHAIYDQAPDVLFERADNEWPGGQYTFRVMKNGRPQVVSSVDQVDLSIPVRVTIRGEVANDFLKVRAQCSAAFHTSAQIRLVRDEKSREAQRVESDITFPVPPVTADCGGANVPVDAVLRALVASQKVQWEARIDAEVDGWLESSAKSE